VYRLFKPLWKKTAPYFLETIKSTLFVIASTQAGYLIFRTSVKLLDEYHKQKNITLDSSVLEEDVENELRKNSYS
jgi:hypothetical protein